MNEHLTPLYHKYPGQTKAQPAHLDVCWRDGSFECGWNAEIGGGVPPDVWYGHRTLYPVSNCLTDEQINDLFDRVRPLVDKLKTLYRSEWDGSNHVAKWDADGYELHHQIEEICAETWQWSDEVELYERWEDWDQDDGDWPEWCDCYGLPKTSTPEQVHEALCTDPHNSNYVVIGSLEALTELRDAWIEELQDA